MENKTAVEWLYEQLKLNLKKIILKGDSELSEGLLNKAKEMQRQQTIDFVYWLTRVDSPYSIMYGGEPERISALDEDFTIEQVYEEYLKQNS